MNYEEEKRRYVSFCGSYCHICDWFTGEIKKNFQRSQGMMEEYGFRKLLEGKVDVESFKLGLQALADSGICSSCKAEVAENRDEDRCEIRQCCHSRGFNLCLECADFPCNLLKTNPGVIKFHCIENLREIEEKGIKHWVDVQWEEFTS